MRLTEAMLTARNKRTTRMQFIMKDENGNYSVQEVPKGVAYIVLPGGKLPMPVEVEDHVIFDGLIKQAIFGKAPKVDGLKVKRRSL